MNNYILVAVDTPDLNEDMVPARLVAEKRIAIGAWPLYRRTPNSKSLKIGDRVFFYMAGKHAHSQSIIGYACIDNIVESSRSGINAEDVIAADIPSKYLRIISLCIAKEAVPIRPLLTSLKLTRNTKKWGLLFQGGCIKLTEADGNLLKNHINCE